LDKSAWDHRSLGVRILILGGDGMLGHQLLRSWRGRHDVVATVRQPLAVYQKYGSFSSNNTVDGVDVTDLPRVTAAVRETAPEAVINCVGIVKQRAEAKAAIQSIAVNALWPHQLLEICDRIGARLVHLSTDCVFSGARGGYHAADPPDALDLYGRSKLLGEITTPPGVTLRSSIIGLELSRKTGLVEWFLAQRGMIRGFRRAIFSGFTTREMARIIERVLERHPALDGVWHVASAPIAKYDLLIGLAERLEEPHAQIVPDESFVCDRSLVGDAFNATTGYQPPSWQEMLDELAGEIRERERTE
jgi:dTDP-4-dehydrorhamnose reductase